MAHIVFLLEGTALQDFGLLSSHHLIFKSRSGDKKPLEGWFLILLLHLQILEENELISSDVVWAGLVNDLRPAPTGSPSLAARTAEVTQDVWATSLLKVTEKRPQVQDWFCQT